VDLATIFALPQFDLRAIILDQGQLQGVTPGRIPVEQMLALMGRRVPYAIGLGTPLRYPQDDGANQFRQYQAGVELILRVLRESHEKVVFTVVGSARDVMAAYNRDPALFQNKVARLYFDDGNSGGGAFQWNPLLDPQAYTRLMTGDLPVYWCPAFGAEDTLEMMAAGKLKPDPTRVYWNFLQADIFSALPAPLQNYFLYALGRKDAAVEDSLAYLGKQPEEILRADQWKQTRHMWSTASIYHAAGCEFYRKGDSWVASRPPVPGYEKADVYGFVSARVTIDRNLRTTQDLTATSGRLKVFRIKDLENYPAAMRSSLRACLARMPLTGPFRNQ
jgi:hypothetical protein